MHELNKDIDSKLSIDTNLSHSTMQQKIQQRGEANPHLANGTLQQKKFEPLIFPTINICNLIPKSLSRLAIGQVDIGIMLLVPWSPTEVGTILEKVAPGSTMIYIQSNSIPSQMPQCMVYIYQHLQYFY